LASIVVIVWYFDPVGDLPLKVTLSLLAAAMSFLLLIGGLGDDEAGHKFGWTPVWMSAFSVVPYLS